MFLTVMTFSLAQAKSSAGVRFALHGLVKSPIDQASIRQADAALRMQKFKTPEIARRQSFRLTDTGKSVGVLVTGRVQAATERRNHNCFVTLLEPGLVPTIVVPDTWQDSSMTCDDVRAVGIMDVAHRSSGVYIGVIFTTGGYFSERRDSGYTQYDAVVFAWNSVTHRMDVDLESTEKAFKGGAQTLDELQQSLR